MTVASFLASLPPPLVLAIGAVGIALTRSAVRGTIAVVAALLAVLAAWHVPDGPALQLVFLGYDIVPVSGSPLQRLFALTFSATALLGGLFAWRYASGTELTAAYVHAATAVGVSLAGDLIAAYLYLQLMLVASAIVVWSGGRGERAIAGAAGIRYALMLLVAGILLKLGIEGVKAETGTAALQPLVLGSVSSWLLLAGLLVHAAAPPVSAWLSDAYPASSPTGTMFLAAYMTQCAVLLLLVLFPGADILLWLGLMMIGYGLVYGITEADTRRLLCFALVTQLGFMLTAIGIGTAAALNGAAGLAAMSALHLMLLFMCTAVAIHGGAAGDLRDVGLVLRRSRLLAGCAAIAVASLAAIPLTGGFVALPTLVTGVREHTPWLGHLLTAAHVGVVVFVAGKLFGTAAPDRNAAPLPALPVNVRLALVLAAVACLLPGLVPHLLHALLPHAVTDPIYTGARISGWLALGFAALAVFVVARRALARTRPIRADSDWLWRVLIFRGAGTALESLARSRAWLESNALRRFDAAGAHLRQLGADDGKLARPWSAGTAVLWVVVMLAGYALIYYL